MDYEKVQSNVKFVLESVNDASCRYFSAHQAITVLEYCTLVAIRKDLSQIWIPPSNTDVIEPYIIR